MTGRENSEAITAVIEKLTEIVGSNESTQDGFERHADANETEYGCDSKTDGEVEDLADASQMSKPTSAVLMNVQNLLPVKGKTESVSTLPLSHGGSSQKGKVISSEQMVLNFPIKLANLNIASPQGLLETLQKLNAKLKVGIKEVDLNTPQPEQEQKCVKAEEMEDCEVRMLFKCSKCNYSSHNKHYLKQHTGLVHNAERLYKCPFCDYAGKRSYSLKEHLIVHSTYRPYECSYCNASFRKKGHLTNHVKMHSSQKTLACVLCHVTVQNRTQLYEHLRQDHDADSVYACDMCEYATAIKSNIVMHMHTHGDPKVYKCRGCQFTAPHVNIIQQHLKSIHRDNGTVYSVECAPDKPGPMILMKCSECGYTCTNKDVLKDHILQQHIDVSDLIEGFHETDTDTVGEQVNRYKCVQCNYINSEAYPFITHILSHKPKVPLTQALQEEACQTKATPADDASSTAATATGSVTVPKQHFTHDASNGMYRCAICNYTCEFQRTIKAHIWKHSGHKDIDYPMFQNGPLSVYDDTPVGMSILLSSKAPVSHVASAVTERNTERSTNMAARPITITSKKPPTTKASAETSDKPLTPQPGESPSGDKYKTDPSIQKAIGRISSKGPVMVILSAAEKKKQQQQQENPATTSTDTSLKEKVKLSASGVSSDSGDHSARPASHKVVQAAPVKMIQRPPATVATTVHIVQSPASRMPPAPNHKAPALLKQTQKPAAGDLNQKKREDVVTTLLAGSSGVLPSTGRKRKHSQDGSLSDGENMQVIAKKRSPEGSCLVQPETPSNTKCGGKSYVAMGNVPKFDLTKVLASSDVYEEVKPVPETLRRVEGNVEKPGKEIDVCEQLNSDKENMMEPKYAEKTKEKTSSVDAAPPSGTSSVPDEACCSTTVSCDNGGETPENDDGSKPNAGICQSLLAVIEQLRSRSESEGDDLGVDGSTSGAKRKCKLSGEWLAGGNEHVEICDGQYRCRLCHYKSASAAVVGIHMRLHKEKQPSECSLCDFQSDTSESLQEHMLQHCKLRTYQCRLCDCIFNYKSQLRAHMRAHIGTQLDVCRLCGFAAVDAAALSSHMDTHVKSGEIRQSLKTEAEQPDVDQLHADKDNKTDTERGEKSETYHMVPHKCDACSFTTTSQTYLAEHHHRQHGVDEKELECELCEFVAMSVRSLKSHMKRHINDQRFVLQPLEQYKCNLCGYVCHHLPSLKSHMWRHASDSNYSYERTNSIINAAIDFDMQRCVKRPPQEYRCNMCGYVCYHLPSLKSHMWRHSSDQNYHYKFMTDDFLNSFAVSQLVHDGKNAGESVLPLVTFRCCQCGFESTDKASLSDHMVVHADVCQTIVPQENANVSDGDVEMVTVEECVEEVTVTTCVQ